MLRLQADEIRWTLDEREPAPCRPAEDVGPPPGLTASRADLVVWWRWRYAELESENARAVDLLVQALGEAQDYRQVLRAALDILHNLTHKTRRQQQVVTRLRDEIRRLGESVKAVTV